MEHLENLMETLHAYRRHNGGKHANIVLVSPEGFNRLIEEVHLDNGPQSTATGAIRANFISIWGAVVRPWSKLKDNGEMYAFKITAEELAELLKNGG